MPFLMLLCCLLLGIIGSSFGWVNPPYNQTEALSYVYLAYGAFCAPAALMNWTCAWCSHNPEFKPFAVFYNETTNAYGYGGYYEGNIVVSFRGSQGVENWLLDLDWTQVVPHEHIKGGLVHTGFNQAYDSIKPQVRKAVLAMLDGPCKGCVITTTGHSLGAAISGMAGVDLVFHLNQKLGMNVSVGIRNYGMPRIGNAVFASVGGSMLVRMERYVHRHDDVPHAPPQYLFGDLFHHMAQEIWNAPEPQQNNSQVKLCDYSGEDPNCSDSLEIWQMYPPDHMYYFGIHNTNCK